MPIYGEYVPPSPAIGRALASGAAGAVSHWEAQLGLGIAPTTTLNLFDGTQAGLQLHDGSTTPVSDAGTARLRYNAGALEVSLNAAAYMPLGGGSLDAAYDFGGAGAGRTIIVDSGAVRALQDNLAATQIAGFSLENSIAATAGVPLQYSGMLEFVGHAWNTTGAGSDNELRMGLLLEGSSATTPRPRLNLRQKVGAAAWEDTGLMFEKGAAIGGLVFNWSPGTATTYFYIRTPGDQLMYANQYALVVSPITNFTVVQSLMRAYGPTVSGAASATTGFRFGYGRAPATATLGTDTFSPTTAANRYHASFESIYSPSAAGLAANFAAVQIVTTNSGNSGTGYVTGLAVAVNMGVTTTGSKNIVDFGTTSTDYFTGYTSRLKLKYTSATDIRLQLNEDGGGYSLYECHAGGTVKFYAGWNISYSRIWTAGSYTTMERAASATGQEVLRVIGPADTAKTAGTERYDVYFNLDRTVQWATGAITNQRAIYIERPTYAFVAASTISFAATVYIQNAPAAGANATLGFPYALWVDDGDVRIDGNLVGYTDGIKITRATCAGVSNPVLTVTGRPDTNRTVSTEYYDVNLALGRTVQWATGDFGFQRFVYIDAPTVSFVGASTIGYSATVYIAGAPRVSGVGAITNPYALMSMGPTMIAQSLLIVRGDWSTAAYPSVALELASEPGVDDAAIQMWAGSAAAVSAASAGRIRYNEGTNTFQMSTNGGAYVNIGAAAGVSIGDAVTGGTTGSILFVGAGPVFAQDNDKLFFDATNFRLGVGTASPLYTVDVTHPAIATGVNHGLLRVVGAADTNRTLSTEVNDVYFNLGRTVEWATGALGNQRAFYISTPIYAFVGASTITNAATLFIEGSPGAGANCTITNPYAIWISSSVNQYGSAIHMDNAAGGDSVTTTTIRAIGHDNEYSLLFTEGVDYDEVVGNIAWKALGTGSGPSAAPNATKGSGVFFLRSNGIASPGEKTQACIMWEDNSITVIAEGPAS